VAADHRAVKANERRVDKLSCRFKPARSPTGVELPRWIAWIDHDELSEIEAIYRRAADGAPLDEARLTAIEAAGRQRELAWPDAPWEVVTRSGGEWWFFYGRAHYDRPKGTSLAAWTYAKMAEARAGVVDLAARRRPS
jgi:hypothetical protein